MRKLLPALWVLCSVCVLSAARADTGIQIQMLDKEIQSLEKKRNEEMAQLEKCAKSVKGFKIAGITTVVLTGVGIGVNVGQAVRSKKLDKDIDKKETELEKAKNSQKQKDAEDLKTREDEENKKRTAADTLTNDGLEKEMPELETSDLTAENTNGQDDKAETKEEKAEETNVKRCPQSAIDCTKSQSFMAGRGKNAKSATQKCTDTEKGPVYASCIITACNGGYKLNQDPDKGASSCVANSKKCVIVDNDNKEKRFVDSGGIENCPSPQAGTMTCKPDGTWDSSGCKKSVSIPLAQNFVANPTFVSDATRVNTPKLEPITSNKLKWNCKSKASMGSIHAPTSQAECICEGANIRDIKVTTYKNERECEQLCNNFCNPA
jgi:hypothetical protein